MTTNETYLGDGLYAKYDGFALWLRAPRAGGDHEVALEPQIFLQFLKFAAGIKRTNGILRDFVHELNRQDETFEN